MRIAALVAALSLMPAVGTVVRAETGEKALTDKEKADAGLVALKQIRAALENVEKLVEEAHGERDALRLNCVNERKAQMSGLLKVAELSLEELKAAAKARQSETVDHEHYKITTAAEKVAGYESEARACVGMLAFYSSEAVERQFSDDNRDTPSLDPTRPEPLDAPTFRAPPASPVR